MGYREYVVLRAKYFFSALGIIALIVVAVIGSNYVIGSLMSHETTITERAVVVKRVDLWPLLSTVEYQLDRKTGNELVYIHRFFDSFISVEYNGECECIISVSGLKRGEHVYRQDSDTAWYWSGVTVLGSSTVTMDSVQDIFDDGMAIRNKVRERFVDLIPPS